MTVIPITCDNCGAKYKLPPTFKGSQAKCQKCGSVIDVAKQREASASEDSPAAAAKPATARRATARGATGKPAAAAKPAVDRSKVDRSKRAGAASSGGSKDKPARATSSRSRRGAKDDGDEDTPRRGREKKKDNMPMILGGVGLLAIIVVVAVVMMKSDDKKPSTDEQAASNTATSKGGAATSGDAADANKGADASNAAGAEQPKSAANATEANAAEANTAEANTPEANTAENVAPPGDAKPDADSKPADAAMPIPDAAETGDPNRKKERWEKQRNPARTMGDVKSAAELYGEVQWPESIDAATKKEILSLTEDLDPAGGIRSIRAKNKLIKMGYAGTFGILERLRTLDYRQPEDGNYGFELNKALEEITGGLTASYAAVQAGETMHPAKAQYNTKTVKGWMNVFAKWPDEKSFKKAKRARAKKKG